MRFIFFWHRFDFLKIKSIVRKWCLRHIKNLDFSGWVYDVTYICITPPSKFKIYDLRMTREQLNRKNLNFHAWNCYSKFQNFLFIEKKLKRDLFKRNVSCILFEEDEHHVALLCLYNPFSFFLWYKKSSLKGIRTVYAKRVFLDELLKSNC